MNEDRGLVVLKKGGILLSIVGPPSAEEAAAHGVAAIPLAALTAWQSLLDSAALSAGQKVLIHAAAGGVGSFAVQLAKWRGAYVIGTASTRNQDFVRNLGGR